jgi:hypothetical protein
MDRSVALAAPYDPFYGPPLKKAAAAAAGAAAPPAAAGGRPLLVSAAYALQGVAGGHGASAVSAQQVRGVAVQRRFLRIENGGACC